MADNDATDDAGRTDEALPTAGQILKAAREAKDLSVDRLARALNVDVPAVNAIESDRYAVIGAPVFVRGHLRKYSQLVEISADEVLAAYERAEEPAERVELHPMKPEEAARPEVRLWPAVLLLLILVAGVVWWLLRPTPPPAEIPETAPDSAVPAEPAPSSEAAGDQAISESASQPVPVTRPAEDGALVLPPRSSSAASEPEDADTEPRPAPPAASRAESPDAAENDPPARSEPPAQDSEETAGPARQASAAQPEARVPASTTRQPPREAAPARRDSLPADSTPAVSAPAVSGPAASVPAASAPAVSPPPVSELTIEQELFASSGPVAPSGLLAEFVFSADSWIDVRDASGARLVYALGRAGTTRTLRAEAPLTVFLGYADGVEVRIEGRPWPVPDRVRRGNTARFTLEAP